jgi:acetyl esterase/lipase
MTSRPLLTLPTLILLVFSGTTSSMSAAAEPEFELLWPQGAPQAMGEKDSDRPGLWIYPAGEKPNGAAVIICPGGGYAVHATDHEGVQPARYFNSIGVTAFVLRYRLAPYRHPVPLLDAQRAIRYVRHHAEKFQIDPNRIGIMGFSAGGHLTSTAVTHFDSGLAAADDPIDRLSCRPNFGILGYPVVSFIAEYSHRGSARNLLGENASDEQLRNLSNELLVTQETPPVFLFHTSEDTGVPPEHSLAFYAACHKVGVPAELHIYQQGPHGVGLAFEHPALQNWIDAAGTWLRQNALLAAGDRNEVKGTVTRNGQPVKWGSTALKPKNPNAPVGWAMVVGGKFTIPRTGGPLLGDHEAVLTDMGAVAPAPTTDGAVVLPVTLPLKITTESNEFQLDFRE